MYRSVWMSSTNVRQNVDYPERRLPRAVRQVRHFGIEGVAQAAGNVRQSGSVVDADALLQS